METIQYSPLNIPNVEVLDLAPPENTTKAELKNFYPQINSRWVTGFQEALSDGSPYVRQFSYLTFPQYQDVINLIDLGYFDEAYKGNQYFQVLSKFKQHQYYSANTKFYNNFSKWEYKETIFYQDLSASLEILNTLRWERPRIDSIPVDGVCSSAGQTIAGQTGTAPAFLFTNPNNNQTVCRQYLSLPIPFFLDVYVGGALGATIQSDSSFRVFTKNTLTDTGQEVANSAIILLNKPYLRLLFASPTASLPTFVSIQFRGKELWRSFYPAEYSSEKEYLLHPPNTSFAVKIQPPGQNFNSNFWNNNPNQNPLIDFSNRQTRPAAFI